MPIHFWLPLFSLAIWWLTQNGIFTCYSNGNQRTWPVNRKWCSVTKSWGGRVSVPWCIWSLVMWSWFDIHSIRWRYYDRNTWAIMQCLMRSSTFSPYILPKIWRCCWRAHFGLGGDHPTWPDRCKFLKNCWGNIAFDVSIVGYNATQISELPWFGVVQSWGECFIIVVLINMSNPHDRRLVCTYAESGFGCLPSQSLSLCE